MKTDNTLHQIDSVLGFDLSKRPDTRTLFEVITDSLRSLCKRILNSHAGQ